ncbi:MAG: YdbL family protein [Candidatus Jettenia sp. CY-1]|nr:MAG: YdbL family protein [Candidatus Jettenia sp. CY-1]
MMNKAKFFTVVTTLFIFATFIFTGKTYAEDIKARMQSRLPLIKELKAKGIVGENNKGYLEFVGNVRKEENVVNDENSDRREIYAAIAAQQGADVEVVGKRRAEQIAGKASSGEWLQDANGKWYKKSK